MKLLEALHVSRRPVDPGALDFRVALICGFQPVHLTTFLSAHLRLLLPERRVAIVPGLFEDILGSLAQIEPLKCDGVLINLEWSDFDVRLGVRQLGTWNMASEGEIAEHANAFLERLSSALPRIAQRSRVVCSMPTLSLPPFAHTSLWQASPVELKLRQAVNSFALAISEGGIQILNPGELDRRSPPSSRRDIKSEIFSGFPYQMPYTDVLAELSAWALAPPPPKKGVITDLDGTLWNGILGEVGIGGLDWDLDHNSQVHGLYQQLLRSLVEAGALIAVASKNNSDLVGKALGRPDLLLSAKQIFPVEANWGPKSESIRKILGVWNITADSVVFIDDSLMELAEVKAAFPQIHCLHFTPSDPAAVHRALYDLRNLLGKSNISLEDSIRAESIRGPSRRVIDSQGEGAAVSDAFLREAEAVVTIASATVPIDPRALELINKTNQFNMNGRRLEETEWKRYVSRPDTAYFLVSYSDKFGPLGKIAVLCGKRQEHAFLLDIWVMSCRAFSRRIEHACLQYLFDKLAVARIQFNFRDTERNGPMREFLNSYLDTLVGPRAILSRESFIKKSPKLFAELAEG
jgi:FkbH-like protein